MNCFRHNFVVQNCNIQNSIEERRLTYFIIDNKDNREDYLCRGETNIVNKISDFKSWYYDSIGITIHLPTTKKEIVIKVRKKYTFIFFYIHM